MDARILLNGREVKDALAVIDTLNKKYSIETVREGEKILNGRNVYVEVNIFGDIDLSEITIF